MKIRVPPWAESHFWEEPPEGAEEFWAFRQRPVVQVGDELRFERGGKIVATAIVSRIEAPGESACDHTGGFCQRWKVFWAPESFKDLRPGVHLCAGPDWWGASGKETP